MPTFAELLDAYRAGPDTLRQAVAGLTAGQLRARPVPGKWSALEVVCHLADSDAVHADRMKRVIAEERPPLIGFDESHFAARLAYHDRDVAEELEMIARIRRQMERILRAAGPNALGRIGVHNEAGPRTLEQILAGAVGHIPHHARFIHEKRAALGV